MQYFVMQSGNVAYIVETDDISKAQTRFNRHVATCVNEYIAQLLVATLNTNIQVITLPEHEVMTTELWHCVSWPLRTWLCGQHKIEINDTICPACPNRDCLGKA